MKWLWTRMPSVTRAYCDFGPCPNRVTWFQVNHSNTIQRLGLCDLHAKHLKDEESRDEQARQEKAQG
jgi:hypothetical protein